jgi:dihydroorotate dehydrogenase electron transfer subunit
VVENRAAGGYRIFSAMDVSGPEPRAGQFYMLAAADAWAQRNGRPYLPRAFAVAEARAEDAGMRLDFLVEDVGPGTKRLASLRPGEGLWLTGPLGRPFSHPAELGADLAGAILVGGGIGLATLAILRRELADRGVPVRTLLGFRDREHAGAVLLEGDAARTAAVYACGPPAMLETVRALCMERQVGAELAMEAPMACGFGACMGCAVPLAAGGYARLCTDGPVVKAAEIETALVPGSGH